MNGGFCYRAKYEAASAVLRGRREKLAFLSAVVHTSGSLMISDGELSLVLETGSGFIKQFLDNIIKEIYKSTSIDSGYRSITLQGAYLDRLLADCAILSTSAEGEPAVIAGIDPSLISGPQSAAAYVRGAFSGCGSVSLLKGYHLEFALSNPVLAADLSAILEQSEIVPKQTVRKDKHIVYLKEAGMISDTLALMGANKAVLEINEMIARRQVNQLSNRRLNCDIANIDKTVNAAQDQIFAIEKIRLEGRFSSLSKRLAEAAEARLNFPDASLSELSSMLNISKSGIKHRLNKILEISKQ